MSGRLKHGVWMLLFHSLHRCQDQHIKLGTGIIQISSRVPPMIAMTAQSSEPFRITASFWVWVSGPQVVEGLHGASFAKPLLGCASVEIIQMGLRSERVAYDGEHYVLPRPGGEGKPIRLSQPPAPDLPIYLATLDQRRWN